MTDEQKPKTEKIENLELNRETVADLTELETEEAKGGVVAASGDACAPGSAYKWHE
jgi:hypothetical protein